MSLRLHITAEGRTEETFVNKILKPYLADYSVWADVRCVLTSKDKRSCFEYRGGFRRTDAYGTVKKDIGAWMKEDRDSHVIFTTMFDLYALPDDFPGFAAAKVERDHYRRVEALEETFAEDVMDELDDRRFIPYIQLHEFEALILADPRQLDWEFLEHDQPIQRLVDMVALEGGNPEMIDDGENTAPSKRIIAEIPEYERMKASSGPIVAGKIGVPTLRQRCVHFDRWIDGLIGLAKRDG